MQSYLSKSPSLNKDTKQGSLGPPLGSMGGNFDSDSESDLSSVDNINVSDSESELDNNIVEHLSQSIDDQLKEDEADQDQESNDEKIIDSKNIEGEFYSPEELSQLVTEINIDEKNNDGYMDKIDKMENDSNNDTKIIELKSTDKKVGKRLSPDGVPKNFDVSHQEVSENDGNTYEVVANKNGTKRWKKV